MSSKKNVAIGAGVATVFGPPAYLYVHGFPKWSTDLMSANGLPQELPHEVNPSYICAAEMAPNNAINCNAPTALATIATKKQVLLTSVKPDQLSPFMKETAVVAEGRDFYHENGVSARAMGRAILTDLYYRKILQGGSTIWITDASLRYPQTDCVQAAMKLNPLNPSIGKLCELQQKWHEIRLAVEMKHKLEPDNVLQDILNRAYLGNGAYGVRAAAQTYWGVDAKDLTLRQSATLTGLFRQPNSSPALMKENSDHVLELMKKAHEISDQTYNIAIATPLSIRPYVPNYTGVTYSPAAEAMKAQPLVNRTILEADKALQTTTENLGRMGLKIIGTISSTEQQVAVQAVAVAPLAPGEAASLIKLGPDGRTLAMIGGPDYKTSQVNLATGEGGTGRPIGSLMKVPVGTAAVQEGIPLDVPLYTSPANITVTYGDAAHGGVKTWPVAGEEEDGGIKKEPLNLATAKSLNTVFAQLVSEHPNLISEATQMYRDLGMTIPESADHNLSTVLGTFPSNPRDVAIAMLGLLRNMGIATHDYSVMNIVDAKGQVIYQHASVPGSQVVSSEVALKEIQVTRGTAKYGTAAQTMAPIVNRNVDIASKTGTTDGGTDAWYAAVTTSGVIVVWQGNPNQQVRNNKLFGAVGPGKVVEADMAQSPMPTGILGEVQPAVPMKGPPKAPPTPPSTTTIPAPPPPTSVTTSTPAETTTTGQPTPPTTKPRKHPRPPATTPPTTGAGLLVAPLFPFNSWRKRLYHRMHRFNRRSGRLKTNLNFTC